MTEAEKRLWVRIRDRQLEGFKFRRQHPVGRYVADFACIEAKLIVELDGGQHADNPKDLERTVWLESQGWCVIRFWNNEVFENLDGVLEHLSISLSPFRGRGPG